MTDNRTIELRHMLDERGVEHKDFVLSTEWYDKNGVKWNYFANNVCTELSMIYPWVNITPEQAIAATLGSSNDIAKALIDDMLDFIGNCCETTLDFGCCDPVDCKYLDGDGELAECTKYQDFLSRAKAVTATLSGGKLTAEQVCETVEKHWHDLPSEYDMPEASALPEYSYDWQAIANELNAVLGSDRIAELEAEVIEAPDTIRNELEDGGLLTPEDEEFDTRWHKLFGTPERTARTMAGKCCDCCECVIAHYCEYGCDDGCLLGDSVKLLEWLRGKEVE